MASSIAAIAPLGALLLGLVVGSFLNVLILRMPRRMQAELGQACAELDGAAARAGRGAAA